MTIGQCRMLDFASQGIVHDGTGVNKVVVAAFSAMAGTLTITDKSGTKLTVPASTTGAYSISGTCYKLAFQYSNPADVGSALIAFHPL